jgi:hypothetical protein
MAWLNCAVCKIWDSGAHGNGGDNGAAARLLVISLSSFVIQHESSDGLRHELGLGIFDTVRMFLVLHKEKNFVIVHDTGISPGQQGSAANNERKSVSDEDDPIPVIIIQFLQ